MSAAQAALIERARARDGEILPCASKASLDECFTMQGGRLVLWYNLPSGDTHVAMAEVAK